MRLIAFISALTALATAIAAAATTNPSATISATDLNSDCGTELPCSLVAAAQDRTTPSTTTQVIPRSWTNAQRLARGLPPKPPHRRSATRRHDHPVPSATPTYTMQGKIQVIRAEDEQSLGYVSANTIGSYAYRYHPDSDSALVVSASLPTGQTSGSKLNLVTENSNIPMYHHFGAVQGRDDTSSDLSDGSFQYAYLTSINPTGPGIVPQNTDNAYTAVTSQFRTSESSIWFVDFRTGELAPRWVNEDGSSPAVQVFSQSDILYLGGDADAFQTRYTSPVTLVNFKFIPI